MRIEAYLGAALLATTLVGCCPGSMLGNGAANVTSQAPVKPAQSPDSDGDGIFDSIDKCPNTARGAKVNKDGCSADQLAALAPPKPAPPAPTPVPVPPTPVPPAPSRVEQELTTRAQIRLENVYFESNSAKLTPESTGPLDEAGTALEKFPVLKLEVEGHTDVSGPADLNLRLSQARAETVRQYLLDRFKLKAEQLTAKGYGESRAETAGLTPQQRKQDRRVVLRVLNPEALPKNVDIKK